MFLVIVSIAIVIFELGLKGSISPVMAGLMIVVVVGVLAGGVRSGARPSLLSAAIRPALVLISAVGLLDFAGGDAAASRELAVLLFVLGFLIFILWRVVLGVRPRER